jgi:hypothetical protein
MYKFSFKNKRKKNQFIENNQFKIRVDIFIGIFFINTFVKR